MAKLERRNPLPPGRYWIDIFGNDIPAFQAWLIDNRPSLTVVKAEDSLAPGQPQRWWVLFVVRAPVAFDAARFGFPTIAPADVQTSADTVQRPPPDSTVDVIVDTARDVKDALPSPDALKAAVPLIALGFALWLISKR